MNSLLYKKASYPSLRLPRPNALRNGQLKQRVNIGKGNTHTDITGYKEPEKPLEPTGLEHFGAGKQANVCSLCVCVYGCVCIYFLYFLIKSPTWRLRPGECEYK